MKKNSIPMLILSASCAVAGCSSTTSPSAGAPAVQPAASTPAASAGVGVQGGKQPTPSVPNAAIVVQGLVNGLSGRCPNRTFVLGNRTVITSAATLYNAGACETLVFSQRVDVTGIADGFTLRALNIRQQKNKDRP